MKQTKHIWWTFSPWEADALRQYLEQLALEGWYPECIGTTGMKCRLGEPEKRRYVAVLAPKTSVLTGADSWDAGKFRERCEAAGEPVDWTAPLSEGGTPEDLVKADALADTALYAAVGTWAAAYGCTLTDAERNALPERHYAYLTLEQGRHLTETGVQYAKLYALYETPGSALAPAENELALFEQQTAPLTAERLLIPFGSDREAARQKAAELFAHLPSLQDAVAALEPGQFSGIIETENGFVILRRLPADRDALREAYFDSLLQDAADASEIQVSSAYETLRPAAFWTALKQTSG